MEKILDECIDWLQNASDEQIRKMQSIYKEEKKNFSSNSDGIEILLPSQMYCKSEFNETYINGLESFAA